MTDDTMALRGLLEKSSDAELLREMIRFAAERLMALEVAALLELRQPAGVGDDLPGRQAGLGSAARWAACGDAGRTGVVRVSEHWVSRLGARPS